MKELITELEEKIKQLKKAHEEEEKSKYKQQPHKDFSKGDIVSNGTVIGVVEWTENKGCNCPHEDGYMGINIINGNRGFSAFEKRDEYEKVNDPYYTDFHKMIFHLTGLEIEELKYSLGPSNCNPNKTKSKILDILNSVRNES